MKQAVAQGAHPFDRFKPQQCAHDQSNQADDAEIGAHLGVRKVQQRVLAPPHQEVQTKVDAVLDLVL